VVRNQGKEEGRKGGKEGRTQRLTLLVQNSQALRIPGGAVCAPAPPSSVGCHASYSVRSADVVNQPTQNRGEPPGGGQCWKEWGVNQQPHTPVRAVRRHGSAKGWQLGSTGPTKRNDGSVGPHAMRGG
jgi:hypothetical protein